MREFGLHPEEMPLSSGDPLWALRFVDARFEPRDPIFDNDALPALPRRRRPKRAAAAAAAAVLTTIACGTSERAALAHDAILVSLSPGGVPPVTEGAASAAAVVPLERIGGSDEKPLLRVPLPPRADPVRVADEVSRSPDVAFAEPVAFYRAARVPDDARFRDQWGLAAIHAPDAWTQATGERSVVVAVVDDGVALDHPDLRANLWTNPLELPANGVDDDHDGIVDDVHGANFVGAPSGDPSADRSYHGTHVAGLIGAAGNNGAGISGVSWAVSLMSVRALSTEGGRSDDLVRAIDYAVDHGARIINASWSGLMRSEAVEQAIARANARGVLFVAAAGNDGASTPAHPANALLDNLISVGASEPGDALAPFSNRGALVAAPGVGMLSTTAPGRYERYDGTSTAAPLVSGLAALLWSAHPAASAAQVRSAILGSGVSLEGAAYGRVDAQAALATFDAAAAPRDRTLVAERGQLSFRVRPGHAPSAQHVLVRAQDGGAVAFRADASTPWITLDRSTGMTPQALEVRVDAAKLPGSSTGAIEIRDDAGGSVSVLVRALAAAPAIEARGCAFRADGKLHGAEGSGCVLAAQTPTIGWVLPGGLRARGAQLYAQLVRRGEFVVTAVGQDGEEDAIPLVIE